MVVYVFFLGVDNMRLDFIVKYVIYFIMDRVGIGDDFWKCFYVLELIVKR